jgi:rubredoxin
MDVQDLCSQFEPSTEDRDIGWRCRPCGWETYDLADMHTLVNWPNPDGSISLVCPSCGAEGDFVDAER